MEKTSYPTNLTTAKTHNYNYWKSKPVKSFDEETISSENIEPNLENRKVYSSNSPIKLPNTMTWVKIDVDNIEAMNVVSQFLNSYYLIDDSGKFMLDYNTEFLKWAIGSNSICLAIMSKESNTMYGFISASFKIMTVFERTQKFAVVDFLCAHPKFRTKNIAQTLIDEIVRQIVKTGVNQGCFTTERFIPTPISTIRFYHRPLNYIKLQQYDFMDLEITKPANKKDPVKIQARFDIKGNASCIPMTVEHINEIKSIYNIYMSKYNIYTKFTEDQLIHNLLGNPNIVKSFVYLDLNGKVLDFFSYYKLDSRIVNSENKINAGYLYLYSLNSINPTHFINDLMRVMKNDNMDVLNVTDTMAMSELLYTDSLQFNQDSEDESFTKSYQLGFIKGSGKIYLNFFNWKCPAILPSLISWTTF